MKHYPQVPVVLTDELVALKRATIESLYFAKVNIWTTVNERKPGSVFMEETTKFICKDEPCRITSQLADPVQGNPKEAVKRVNLMVAPEWDIPEGSSIEVTYNGYTKRYRMSAPPYHYSDHQTISLLEYTEEKGDFA